MSDDIDRDRLEKSYRAARARWEQARAAGTVDVASHRAELLTLIKELATWSRGIAPAEALNGLSGLRKRRGSLARLREATDLEWARVRGSRSSFEGEVRLSVKIEQGRLRLDQSGPNGEWILRLWPAGVRGVPPVLWAAPMSVKAPDAVGLLDALRRAQGATGA
jgi:hypothetical protein